MRWFVLLLLLLVWAIPMASRSHRAEERGPETLNAQRLFSHRDHVPAMWLRSGEVERDCLGCHESGERSPGIKDDVCGACHYEGFVDNLAERRPAEESLSLAKGDLPSFLHRDHVDRLECKACHAVRDAVPDDLPTPVGAGHCIQCHDPGVDRRGSRVPGGTVVDVEVLLDRFLARLNSPKNSSMGPREAPFRHADHLVVDRMVAPGADGRQACAACHSTTWTSVGIQPEGGTFDLGSKTFDAGTCDGCHILPPENGRPPEGRSFETTTPPERSVSLTAGTFSHADHDFRDRGDGPRRLKAEFESDPGLRSGKKEIEEKGCLACHERGVGARGAYALKGGPDAYGVCMPCHDAWNVEAFGDRPHGEFVRDTGACAGCHVLGFVADMKSQRPRIRMSRTYLASVRIRKQAHPFITRDREGSGNATDGATIDECGKCHLARLDELASRLETRTTFYHSAHLPSGGRVSESHCLRCHVGSEWMRGPDRITESANLFEEKVCSTCHVGSGIRVAQAAESTPVTRPVFRHVDHYATRPDGTHIGRPRDGRSAAVLTCDDCHDGALDDGGRRRIGTRSSALTCVPCHNHGAAAESTGRISQASVENCQKCHRHGVPAGRSSLARESLRGEPRRRITRIGMAPPGDALPGAPVAEPRDRQFHPRGRACGECHRVRKQREETLPSTVWGEGTFSSSRGGGFHREFPWPRRQGELVDCHCCHWAQQQDASVSCDARTPDVRALRTIRGTLGSGFPGASCGRCPP